MIIITIKFTLKLLLLTATNFTLIKTVEHIRYENPLEWEIIIIQAVLISLCILCI